MSSLLRTVALVCVVSYLAVGEENKEPKQNEGNIRKVIIDSDGAANDIFALVYALQSYKNGLVDIKAVTTVQTHLPPYHAFRNIVHMVNITSSNRMKKQFSSIPIAKPPQQQNEESARNIDESQSADDGVFGFSETLHRYTDIMSTKKKCKAAYESASYSDDLLIETILQNPDEISLITMGPLTNLYLAELKHPGILRLVKEIYTFGGEFLNKTGNANDCALSEFNFNYDSTALHEIFERLSMQHTDNAAESVLSVPNVFIFPLDAARKIKFDLHRMGLLYTLLNTDIQTEIEMCRLKMERDADKDGDFDDDLPDESDLFDYDRENDDMDDTDFHCTQTGLLYIFYERMMEESMRANYMSGACDGCMQIGEASIVSFLLYPHLFDFKYLKCQIDKESGMTYFDARIMYVDKQMHNIELPNCFVNLNVDADKVVHALVRDSVNSMHETYRDYMQFMMNNMDWY